MKSQLMLLIYILADVYCQKSLQDVVSMSGNTTMIDQCGNEFDKIWVDVFFVIDTSKAMTRNGFIELMGELASSLSYLTIGQQQHATRVGLITYAQYPSMVRSLRQWNSTDDVMELLDEENVQKWFRQSEQADLAQALRTAIYSGFENGYHRRNVKPVIVIVATAYKPSNGEDETATIASAFKLNGGTIITYKYSQPGSPNVDRLQKLASPGYSFSNAYNLVPDTKIPELLAKANCFCPDPYVPYTYGNAEPKYGCYSMPQATATQKLAEKVCKLKKQGTLAKVENYEKAQFLMGKVSYPQNAWIGLKRINKKWTWPDGSILTGGSFEMWKPGSLNYNENSCVTMYINRTDYKYYWEPESCTKRQKYICQIKPCSASNYCSEVFNAQRLDSLRKTLGAKLLKHL